MGRADPLPEAGEIDLVSRGSRRRRGAVDQQLAQALTILIGSDQFTNILDARAVAAPGYLCSSTNDLSESGSDMFIILMTWTIGRNVTRG
jgi:hypothetical protein